MKKGDWIEYPEYDIAWIGWETGSSYLVSKIKKALDKDNNLSIGYLTSQVESEWILKENFNYKKIKKGYIPSIELILDK